MFEVVHYRWQVHIQYNLPHFFFKRSNSLSKLCNEAAYSKKYFDSKSITFIHFKVWFACPILLGSLHMILDFGIDLIELIIYTCHCFTRVNFIWLCCHLIQVFVRPLVLPQRRAGFCRVLRDSSLETQSLCGSTRLACVHLQLWRAEGSLCLQQLWEGNSLKIRRLKMRRYM